MSSTTVGHPGFTDEQLREWAEWTDGDTHNHNGHCYRCDRRDLARALLAKGSLLQEAVANMLDARGSNAALEAERDALKAELAFHDRRRHRGDERAGTRLRLLRAYQGGVHEGPSGKEDDMPVDEKELETRFTYHAPEGNQSMRYEQIRGTARQLAALIVEEDRLFERGQRERLLSTLRRLLGERRDRAPREQHADDVMEITGNVIARVKKLDELYLEADRLLSRFIRMKAVPTEVSDAAYIAYLKAIRRYRRAVKRGIAAKERTQS